MPYTEHEDASGGVTVTSKDSGKSFHAPSEAAAKRDERLREEFKHMKDAAGAEDGSAEDEDDTDRGEEQGEPGMPEQFAAAFRRRGYRGHREKYQREEREETPVREEPVKKLGQVQANYRSAFSAARCAICAHFQSGSKTCELVAGTISPDGVCDLFQHQTEDATEKANRLFAEHSEKVMSGE